MGFLTTTTSGDVIRDWVHLLFFATLIAALLTLVGILAYQLQQAGRLGWAEFFTAFFGTAIMLMERREHLFSPDFGVRHRVDCWNQSLPALSSYRLRLAKYRDRPGRLATWCRLLLAVGGPINAFSLPIGVLAMEIVSSVLVGLGLLWAGYVLSSDREAVVVAEGPAQL